MIIRKVHNPRGWTSIPNAALENETLSFRARGLLAYLLSRPDGWETDSERLARAGKEGREAVRTALNELVGAGYLVRRKSQGERGRWRTDTFVYDEPVTPPAGVPLDGLDAENLPVESPVDNPVDGLGITPPPESGYRAPESWAVLTRLTNHYESSSQGDSRAASPLPVENSDIGSADGSLIERAGSAGNTDDLTVDALEADAIRWIQTAAPGVPPFALRAHLASEYGLPASFALARACVAHALSVHDERQGPLRLVHVLEATGDYVASEATSSALRARGSLGGSAAGAPAGAGEAEDDLSARSGASSQPPAGGVTSS